MPKIEVNDLGTIGSIVDTPSHLLPPEAWTLALNVHSVDGGMEKLLGWEQIFGDLESGNDSFTKILLHMNGADGAQVFTDSNTGGSAHTWTASTATTVTDDVQKKFGATSLFCDGVGDWITTPDNADFDLGSGDFTIDGWFLVGGGDVTTRRFAGHGTGANVNRSFSMALLGTNMFRCETFVGGTSFVRDSTTVFITAGATWHHVAFVRTSNILRLFIDGVQEGADLAIAGTVNPVADVFGVGVEGSSGTAGWFGWIDEFRLSVGVARWTADFDVPTRESFTTAEIAPHFLMSVNTASATFWLYTSLTKAFCYDGTAHTDITRLSGNYTASNTREWNGTLLGGVPVVNNGTDLPQFWSPVSGSTRLLDLTNWTATLRAKVVRAFGPFLVAFNCTKAGTAFPHMVKWSHPADPGQVPPTWDETDPTADAGETDLSDVQSGVIVDALQLGDTMYIYKEGSVWKMRFVGGRFIFDFGKAAWLPTTGLLAPRCVAATGDGTKHVWATQDDILWHNGNVIRSVLNGRQRRRLFNEIDTLNFANCFMFCNPFGTEMYFCYPTSGETNPNRALLMNYSTGDVWAVTEVDGITFRNAAIGDVEGASDEDWEANENEWEIDDGPWAELERRRVVLAGTDAAKFYNLDKGATRDGTVFTGTLRREGLSVLGKKRTGEWIVDYNQMKMWDEMWPKVEGSAIDIRFGAAQLVDGPITWGSTITFDPTLVPVHYGGPISGRAGAFEFSGTGSWRVDGYIVDVIGLGTF